jgi:hypothetical protein
LLESVFQALYASRFHLRSFIATKSLTAIRWAEIVEACAVRVIAMNQIAEEEDL